MAERVYDWCVVGGGVGGAYAAYRLAQSGQSVVLLEAAPALGGILSSRNWNGFAIDNGCHLFDFGDAKSAEFFDLVMDGNIHPVDVHYASVSDFGTCEGIAVPDLSQAPEALREDLIASVVAASKAPDDPQPGQTLKDRLDKRFGPAVAPHLAPGLDKLARVSLDDLAAEAFDVLSYAKRIRLDDDARMDELKAQSGALDERLARKNHPENAPQKDDGNTFEHRNYYPTKGGMGEFCQRMKTYLEGLGVDIQTKYKVEGMSRDGQTVSVKGPTDVTANKVFWSLPTSFLPAVIGLDLDSRPFFHPISAHIWAFQVPADQINDVTYIHDYTAANPIFRSSSAGLYSRQVNQNGQSFVLGEVYDSLVSPKLEMNDDMERNVFGSLKRMGQIHKDASYSQSTKWTLPAALAVPKVNWLQNLTTLEEATEARADWLVAAPLRPRGKRSIFGLVEEQLG